MEAMTAAHKILPMNTWVEVHKPEQRTQRGGAHQ